MVIRVVIADDSYLIRQAVGALVDDEGDLELVASVSDLDGLLSAVEVQRPDVVVTDVRMPPSHTDEGVRAATRIREVSPATGVVVLSQVVRREYAVQVLGRGAAGRAYLLKDRVAEAGELAEAVRTVARGGSVVDPLVVDELLSPVGERLASLTARELEVLGEMARGRNNAGIGRALSLTEGAVAKHINAIFTKLELSEQDAVHRRVQAVLLYLGTDEPEDSDGAVS